MPATSMPSESSGAPKSGFLETLRRAILTLEGTHPNLGDVASFLPFGVAGIDEALGGGLPRAALHEIAAANEADMAAATGFALVLAAHCAQSRAVLWIAEDMARLESGVPYGPGLDEIGLAPERLLTVTAARPREVLGAMEEALRCPAIGAVIGEIRKDNALDDVANRRLSLAAARQDTLGLLLRPQPDGRSTAATTRWTVGAAPSISPSLERRGDGWRHGTGPPAFDVRLVRNRYGRLGSWVLEWNCAEHRFERASAHSLLVAPAAADRPDQAAVA